MLLRNYTCHIEVFIPVNSLHMPLQFILLGSWESTHVTIVTYILMNRFIMTLKSPLTQLLQLSPNKVQIYWLVIINMFRAHVIFIRGMVTYTFQPTFWEINLPCPNWNWWDELNMIKYINRMMYKLPLIGADSCFVYNGSNT